MDFFPPVKLWKIPASALRDSFLEMAWDGINGNEGIMLWLGKRGREVAVLTHMVALRGTGIRKTPVHININPALMNHLTEFAVTNNVVLVGQIHSHGKYFGVDLSPTDRTFGLQVPDYLSIVAPDSARNPNTPINKCGVHVFQRGVGYRRMGSSEIKERIIILKETVLPIIELGREKNE